MAGQAPPEPARTRCGAGPREPARNTRRSRATRTRRPPQRPGPWTGRTLPPRASAELLPPHIRQHASPERAVGELGSAAPVLDAAIGIRIDSAGQRAVGTVVVARVRIVDAVDGFVVHRRDVLV